MACAPGQRFEETSTEAYWGTRLDVRRVLHAGRPFTSERESEREGGKEGGREGERDGEREGGREGERVW